MPRPAAAVYSTSIGEVDDAIEKFLGQRWAIQRLHMTKDRDWRTETEVRLAMIDLKLPEREFDTPLYIPMRDALKAVILGSEYAAPHLVTEGARKLLGTRAPEFLQCTWRGRSEACSVTLTKPMVLNYP